MSKTCKFLCVDMPYFHRPGHIFWLLLPISLQLMAEDAFLVLSDRFIRADPSLEMKTAPFLIKVKEFCFVLLSES